MDQYHSDCLGDSLGCKECFANTSLFAYILGNKDEIQLLLKVYNNIGCLTEYYIHLSTMLSMFNTILDGFQAASDDLDICSHSTDLFLTLLLNRVISTSRGTKNFKI